MRIAFISGMTGEPWGGSEELWSLAALRCLAAGHDVCASVHGWASPARELAALRDQGLRIHERHGRRGWRRVAGEVVRAAGRGNARRGLGALIDPDVRRLEAFRPDLVCISHGAIACGLEWMEWAMARRIPYVSVTQANAEWFWPDDQRAERLAAAYCGARAACFVSEANHRLFELQVARRLANAVVVRNPVKVDRHVVLPWPDEGGGFKLAVVGRLSYQKGTDLILQTLAESAWRERPVQVRFYGRGPSAGGFIRLAGMLGVADRATFEGHVDSITEIWRQNHALLLPSRCEGLPLALVEAMMLRRCAIVTDVAGNREVVDDGVTGFLAAAPTVELVAAAMERAWHRRHQWQAMGEAAGRAIRETIAVDPVGDFVELLMQAA